MSTPPNPLGSMFDALDNEQTQPTTSVPPTGNDMFGVYEKKWNEELDANPSLRAIPALGMAGLTLASGGADVPAAIGAAGVGGLTGLLPPRTRGDFATMGAAPWMAHMPGVSNLWEAANDIENPLSRALTKSIMGAADGAAQDKMRATLDKTQTSPYAGILGSLIPMGLETLNTSTNPTRELSTLKQTLGDKTGLQTVLERYQLQQEAKKNFGSMQETLKNLQNEHQQLAATPDVDPMLYAAKTAQLKKQYDIMQKTGTLNNTAFDTKSASFTAGNPMIKEINDLTDVRDELNSQYKTASIPEQKSRLKIQLDAINDQIKTKQATAEQQIAQQFRGNALAANQTSTAQAEKIMTYLQGQIERSGPLEDPAVRFLFDNPNPKKPLTADVMFDNLVKGKPEDIKALLTRLGNNPGMESQVKEGFLRKFFTQGADPKTGLLTYSPNLLRPDGDFNQSKWIELFGGGNQGYEKAQAFGQYVQDLRRMTELQGRATNIQNWANDGGNMDNRITRFLMAGPSALFFDQKWGLPGAMVGAAPFVAVDMAKMAMKAINDPKFAEAVHKIAIDGGPNFAMPTIINDWVARNGKTVYGTGDNQQSGSGQQQGQPTGNGQPSQQPQPQMGSSPANTQQ